MQKFGVLGRSLPHTLSPPLYQVIYERTGLKAVYNIFEVEPDQLKDVVPSLRTLGFRGCNVTIPYKQDIIQYLDALSPEAETLGAVNTISIERDGRAVGYNTDYFGFAMSLAHGGIKIKGKSFLVCGMSGAGKAIYRSLVDGGASQVLVASTDAAKGIPYSSLPGLEPMDCIVNCTPLGMYPKVEGCIVPEEIFGKFAAAVDIVYNPMETEFLRRAKRSGCKVLGGLYMLVYQGIKSYEILTGETLDRSIADIIYQRLCGEFH